jgi:hypothetical protein
MEYVYCVTNKGNILADKVYEYRLDALLQCRACNRLLGTHYGVKREVIK